MSGYIIVILFFIFVPLILGYPWVSFFHPDKQSISYSYAYVMGFFSLLALFEIVFFPSALADVTFRCASSIYSILLLALIVFLLWRFKKHIRPKQIRLRFRYPIKKTALFYAVVFLLLFSVQIYYAWFYSRTYMADDGYVVYATSALTTNYMNLVDSYTGLYQVHNYYWLYRVIQSFNFFPAYLSLISGLHPAIITHTMFYVLVLVLSYLAYGIMSYQLFDNTESRLMFLCMIATLYIWGYHSHYSLTFRLLGPNNEGKAILAVVLAPFILTIMQDVIRLGYDKRYGIQILVLSISACSLTMGGIYTMAALLSALVLLSAAANKSWLPLLYMVWGGSVPCICAGIYLFQRFAII